MAARKCLRLVEILLLNLGEEQIEIGFPLPVCVLQNARAKPFRKRCYSPCQLIDPIGDCELGTFATISGEAPVRRDSFG